MPHPTWTAEEIARRGEELYAHDLRTRLETEENRGKFLVIDIEIGAYEIDREALAATERLLARHPHAMTYGLRIGYNAVYELGGHLSGNLSWLRARSLPNEKAGSVCRSIVREGRGTVERCYPMKCIKCPL